MVKPALCELKLIIICKKREIYLYRLLYIIYTFTIKKNKTCVLDNMLLNKFCGINCQKHKIQCGGHIKLNWLFTVSDNFTFVAEYIPL